MSDSKPLVLRGCNSSPLASYLKGLGVIRLLSEQYNPDLHYSWAGDCLHIHGEIDRQTILSFFLDSYIPSPITAPWNGGSGFYPKDAKAALDAIESSDCARFQHVKELMVLCKALIGRLGLSEKPDREAKAKLLELCRNEFPDLALHWLDAVMVLTSDGPKFPPLLGTGGNDGRLEFTNNYIQRLIQVIEPSSGEPTTNSKEWLDATLFLTPVRGLLRQAPIGQFNPSAAGGANASSDFQSDSLVNPWEYILMMEGALLFAASCARRIGMLGPGVPTFPFTVRQVGVGYGSSANYDESNSRAEIWLPLWKRSLSLMELNGLFSEGKALVGRRQAANGIDFARAVSTLGVERGISAFQRYGFQVRNGLSYFAIPIGRVTVERKPEVELLDSIDFWLQRVRSKASGSNAPASISRALRNLEGAIWELCQFGGRSRSLTVLIAIGRFEKEMTKRGKWAKESNIPPVPPLPWQWVPSCDDGSIEFRLALSLASLRGEYSGEWLGLRNNLEPIRLSGIKHGERWAQWDDDSKNFVAMRRHNIADNFLSILERRLLRAQQAGHREYRDIGLVSARPDDVAAFLEGTTSDDKTMDLIWGLAMVDFRTFESSHRTAHHDIGAWPPAHYAILKLCFSGWPVRDVKVRLSPTIVHQAHRGGHFQATALASRRLRADGLSPLVDVLPAERKVIHRSAGAILFPVSRFTLEQFADRTCKRVDS